MTRHHFYAVLEDILRVPHGLLKDSDSRDTVANWTSVADVQILAVIKNEFGIEPDLEVLEAETVGELIGVLEAKDAVLL